MSQTIGTATKRLYWAAKKAGKPITWKEARLKVNPPTIALTKRTSGKKKEPRQAMPFDKPGIWWKVTSKKSVKRTKLRTREQVW